MPAPDALSGRRVVADPAAIDALVVALPPSVSTIRTAPDEVLVLGDASLTVDDPHAIVEDEVGFVAITIERAILERHLEWPLPADGGLAQGAIAGVPAKVTLRSDGRAWVVTHRAYIADLLDRLT